MKKQIVTSSIRLLILFYVISSSALAAEFNSKETVTSLGNIVGHSRTEYIATVYPDAPDNEFFSKASNVIEPFATPATIFRKETVTRLQLIVELDSSGEAGFLVTTLPGPNAATDSAFKKYPLMPFYGINGLLRGNLSVAGSLETTGGVGHTLTLYSIVDADVLRFRQSGYTVNESRELIERFNHQKALRLLQFGPFNTIDMTGMSHLIINITLLPGQQAHDLSKMSVVVRGGTFDDKQRRFVYDPRPLFNTRDTPKGGVRLNVDSYSIIRLLGDSLLVSDYQAKTLE
ncbi:hypothetical protein AB835_08440 [Candidatus Endobugula sertula]|uniref:Uncharacterized protein n=1 Tax=Candidatus Endobugula sertula TaxID=62101 RepID=A0A1D2QPK4_9GAMM|nr:hypothetical protein AB835_08440 [Candidatus Endobugula sertula]